MRYTLSAVLLLFLAVPLHAVDIKMDRAGVTAVFARPTEPVVLEFASGLMSFSEQVLTLQDQNGEKIEARIRNVQNKIVLQPPDEGWLQHRNLIITVNDGLRYEDGRVYDGPSEVSVFISNDNLPLPGKNSEKEVQVSGRLDNNVEVYPLPFTPNNDGYNDLLHIRRPGGVGGLKAQIFYLDGLLVTSLEASGNEPELLWNGIDDQEREAPPGPYFIVVQRNGDYIATGLIYLLR